MTTKYEVDQDKLYRLTKLHPDGKQEVKGIGQAADITVGYGAICANWFTTIVQEITLTGKGCLFETLNSTYLLEEFTKFEDKNESKEHSETKRTARKRNRRTRVSR